MADTLEEHDLIQIAPTHRWGGCIAVVDEPKSFGCQAYVSIPSNDGEPPGRAYVRLSKGQYEPLGVKAIFAPAESE